MYSRGFLFCVKGSGNAIYVEEAVYVTRLVGVCPHAASVMYGTEFMYGFE